LNRRGGGRIAFNNRYILFLSPYFPQKSAKMKGPSGRKEEAINVLNCQAFMQIIQFFRRK